MMAHFLFSFSPLALSIFILATHTNNLIHSTNHSTTFTMADDAGALVRSMLFCCILYAMPLPPWLEVFLAALESFVLVFKFAATLNQCRRSSGNSNPCYVMWWRMTQFLLLMYLMIPCCDALVSISLFLLMIFHCIRTISNRN